MYVILKTKLKDATVTTPKRPEIFGNSQKNGSKEHKWETMIDYKASMGLAVKPWTYTVGRFHIRATVLHAQLDVIVGYVLFFFFYIYI